MIDIEIVQCLIVLLHSQWTLPITKEIFTKGLTKGSGGFQWQVIIPEVRVIIDQLDGMPNIKAVFDSYQFSWMAQQPGHYGPTIIMEFYSCYAASLLKSVDGGNSKNLKKQLVLQLDLLDHVVVRVAWVDISETTINKFPFGPHYKAPPDG